jgi:hypothetical protein
MPIETLDYAIYEMRVYHSGKSPVNVSMTLCIKCGGVIMGAQTYAMGIINTLKGTK